ncbi:glucose PTS transporter subunit IIA [Gemella sp. zg-570]|uniref:PTS sugar transporter subunit IIA n=1 Tax=unclassified Gemella TaxID=2624949 RepID=UPI001C05395C|nr:glucose PTS transporter subunit IIA [Gemella sp. zg-1178]QWQ38218.1 glucose PTS transporter subunit IIA [Gemella sp. zg-570]
MLGQGFAILPSKNKLCSPVAGKIINIFPTKHSMMIRTNSGIELLIYIGLDTIYLQAQGFKFHVDVGDDIESGQDLVTFDLNLIKEKAKSTLIPCIITNMELVSDLIFLKKDGKLEYNEKILLVKLK